MSGRLNPNMPAGAIDLTDQFLDDMRHLCMSDDYSDIMFIVEEQQIPAHRCVLVLASRSEYFRTLFNDVLCEANKTEIILKVPAEEFKELLRFIYSGHMILSHMEVDTQH